MVRDAGEADKRRAEKWTGAPPTPRPTQGRWQVMSDMENGEKERVSRGTIPDTPPGPVRHEGCEYRGRTSSTRCQPGHRIAVTLLIRDGAEYKSVYQGGFLMSPPPAVIVYSQPG